VKFVFFFFSEITLGGNTQSMCWSNKVSCSNTTREISRPNWIGDPLTTQFWFCWRLVQVEKKTGTTRGEFRNSAPAGNGKKKKRKHDNKLQPPDGLSQIQLVRWLGGMLTSSIRMQQSSHRLNVPISYLPILITSPIRHTKKKISQTCYHIIIGSSFSFWLRLHLLRINTAICIQRGRLKM
jgi:hypothetical protein